MSRPKQITLKDILGDCLDTYENDKPSFLHVLEEHIDLDSLIPARFMNHFYRKEGRPRDYSLRALIWALLIQRIFSIPTDSLLILFLRYSRALREFCGFTKVPDAAKFTHFKQDFVDDLEEMFKHLVDLTEPICREIDGNLANMIIFDTSGIEAYVKENNPKQANALIKRLKAWKTAHKLPDSYDPYKVAYGMMPPHSAAEPGVKQMYINGSFCYAYKFGLLTNGLGIVRHIEFYDEDYLQKHPEITVEKKAKSPDESKSLADSKALIPTLSAFFHAHPLINPKIFLGDSAFDAIDIYKDLLGKDGLGFEKAYIPLNARAANKYLDYQLNDDGIPCCPHDSTLPMKPEGNTSHLRCGIPSLKFVCPKMTWIICEDGKRRRRTSCENPCTSSACGRMIYVYPEKDFRSFPGTVRGTDEWNETYKIRVAVEKTINHFKDSFCVTGRRSRNRFTAKADLFLAGITQQITVLLANSIHERKFIRSLKPLLAA